MQTSPHEHDAAPEALVTREPLFASEREAREFAANTGAARVGARLRYFETTDSTNTRARRLADLGWPEGTVVVAEGQAAGRGRLGRRWACPARAGLLVSVVLPYPGGLKATWLTAAGALALVDAVEEAGGAGPVRPMQLMIEWPNDIVAADPGAPGGRRKIGGILVEARPPGRGLAPTAVLGAGLNVDIREEEFPAELRAEAGSLVSVFGASPDRREILGRFLVALASRVEWLTDGLAEGLGGLSDELRARSFTLGREVELPAEAPGGNARLGRAVGFDDEMRLVVELPGGATEAVAFRAPDARDPAAGGSP
ncbi:MAG: biotin--[acetyl-CoA-carboxylase] ligase [Planctomycetota bacterium]